MIGPLSALDWAVIGLTLISGLLAMYRGFTRELLSITSWVIAGAAGAYVGYSQRELAQNLAKKWNLSEQLVIAVQGAIGILVFLAVLLVVHLLTMRIADKVLDSHVGMVDRLMGFLFGIVRGLLVIGILFAGYDRFVAHGGKPYEWTEGNEWTKGAYTLKTVITTADVVTRVLEGILPKIEEKLTKPAPQ